jgi:ABC-type dipeptide/oligopeptide/nickel transport system permease component
VFRLSATALLEAAQADYTVTARGKGLSEWAIVIRHQLPNSRSAILAALLFAVQGALSSLAIIEYIFGWPGAGFAFIHSIANNRFAVALGLFILFAGLLGFLGIAVTLSARRGDPRLRVARL